MAAALFPKTAIRMAMQTAVISLQLQMLMMTQIASSLRTGFPMFLVAWSSPRFRKELSV
jgi:hypothetical protein